MKGNWPWILMVLANLIFWIALQQRNTTIVYYLTYNLDRKDLVPLINSLATIQILFIIAIPFSAVTSPKPGFGSPACWSPCSAED